MLQVLVVVAAEVVEQLNFQRAAAEEGAVVQFFWWIGQATGYI